MAVSASRARTLCTASELNLVKWSSPRQIKSLTPAKLKDKIDRARKLRDKYRDLSKKQRGEARGKRKPTGRRPAQSNENTVEKAELFAEVLDRFQVAATKAGSTPAGSKKTSKKKTTGKSASRKKATTTKKKTTGKTGQKVPKKAATKTRKKSSGRTPDTKRTKPTTKAASSKTTPRVALAGSADQKQTASLSASSGSRGVNPLTGSSALEAQAARRTRRKKSAKSARAGGIESRFAATVTDKIQGHISGSNKRRQARRDSKS